MKILKKNKSSGITLIALVVTIIVLLILAGISVQMLTGENGILQRAGEAKEKTEEEQLIEEAKMDIIANQTSKLTGKINEKELKSILSKYGTLSTEEERIIDKKLTTTDGEYVIPVSKIYNGNILEATIENTEPKYFYGDSIDYDVDIEVSLDDKDQYDWKIFYNDGTNIYIIAEDYVRMDNSLMPTITGRINNDRPYSLYNPIQNGKDGSADIFGDDTHNVTTKTLYLANKFLADWKPKVTGRYSASGNSNAKMTAILLDTDLWSYNNSTEKGFTNSTKIQNSNSNHINELFAIGGPTLEMWVKSWNKIHGSASEDQNNLQLYYASNATGYFVGTTANPDINSSYYAYKEGTPGYTDTLYYPHPAVNNSPDTFTSSNYCMGYWLASPSATYGSFVMTVSYIGSVSRDDISGTGWGVRPVVCLPSDITAKWNEADGVWNIIKK